MRFKLGDEEKMRILVGEMLETWAMRMQGNVTVEVRNGVIARNAAHGRDRTSQHGGEAGRAG
jgi:hypothetical protein